MSRIAGDPPRRVPKPPGGSWRLVVVAALAFGLIGVLIQNTGQDGPTTTTTAAVTTTTATAVVVPRDESLVDLVPGLNGTLHTVIGSNPFTLLSWEASTRALSGSDLPAGRPDSLAFDASGEILGLVLRDSSTGSDELLVSGPSGRVQLGRVRSFAWHQTDAGALATISTRFDSDDSELITAEFRPDSGLLSDLASIVSVGGDDIVLAWGTWGFLLRQEMAGTTEVVMLDPSGEEVWSLPAHWAYASPTGDVLLSFYNNEIREFRLVETGGDSAAGPWFEMPSLGVTGVAWAPLGGKVAVVDFQAGGRESRLSLYDDAGALLEEVPIDWRVSDVSWSSDGRFVLMPAIDARSYAVLFYDLQDHRLTAVDFDEAIASVAVSGG